MALCYFIGFYYIKVVTKFYYPLVMYGEGGKMEDGVLQDGEAQLMMGRMVPVLQVCTAIYCNDTYSEFGYIATHQYRIWLTSLVGFMTLYDTCYNSLQHSIQVKSEAISVLTLLYMLFIVSFSSSKSVMQSQGILLQTVFEALGDALTILITLDEIFKAGETFKEHWTQYKR